MPGTRIVLKSRYFYIGGTREKEDGKVGTPLNLDPLKLRPEVAAEHATSKQMSTIADTLHEIPEAKTTSY